MAQLARDYGSQASTSYNNTMATLQAALSARDAVMVGVELSYMLLFMSFGGHAVLFQGVETVNGVQYADFTNG